MTANGLTAIDGGQTPDGWAELWASDRWPLRNLPHADLQGTGREGAILFDRITQPWLREAAKRWARARLLAGPVAAAALVASITSRSPGSVACSSATC
jgi:hypothetical protein